MYAGFGAGSEQKGGRVPPVTVFLMPSYCLPKICAGRVVSPVALGKSG